MNIYELNMNGYAGDENSYPSHISDTPKKCMGYYPDRCMEYKWLSNGYPGDENSYPIPISDAPKKMHGILSGYM